MSTCPVIEERGVEFAETKFPFLEKKQNLKSKTKI
jgi:hypothetical protein